MTCVAGFRLHRHRATRRALLLLLVLAVLLLSCRSGSDEATDGAPSATPITAESVLQRAAEQWDATTSTHFKLIIDGDAFIDEAESLRLVSAEGDIKRPDAVKTTAKIDAAIAQANVSLVFIGDQAWMTNLITGMWEKAPADFSYNPAVLFSASSGIAPILAQITSPTLATGDSLDGATVRRVSGMVDASVVQQITAGAIQGDAIHVTVWVTNTDSAIVQVQLQQEESKDRKAATWTLTLSKRNAAIEITPPVSQ